MNDHIRALPPDHKTISDDDRNFLIQPVSYREVLSTIGEGQKSWARWCECRIYLFYLDIIKEPLLRAISHSFTTARFSNAWGKMYSVLVPKSYNPKTVMDFWLISLCTVSYKIISKSLTNWLKHVIYNLVMHELCAFLAGKSSFDNILAIQDIVHSLESDTGSPPRMLIKVDIAKEYDMVEWKAILSTLHLMNFLVIWVNWIRAFAFLVLVLCC